jgi:hypothetical protein
VCWIHPLPSLGNQNQYLKPELAVGRIEKKERKMFDTITLEKSKNISLNIVLYFSWTKCVCKFMIMLTIRLAYILRRLGTSTSVFYTAAEN